MASDKRFSISGLGFDSPYGHCGVEELGLPRRTHNPGLTPVQIWPPRPLTKVITYYKRQFQALREQVQSILRQEL